MSAFRALDAARAAGIEVQLDGKDLVLSGASAPPTDVLDKLRKYKLSIVALLQKPPVPRDTLQPTQPWDPDDWRAFYDEQVRIAEYDGLSRPAAEARAYDCCVAEWLWSHFGISAPGPCPICGDARSTERSTAGHRVHRRTVLAAQWMREGLVHCPESRGRRGAWLDGDRAQRAARHEIRSCRPTRWNGPTRCAAPRFTGCSAKEGAP